MVLVVCPCAFPGRAALAWGGLGHRLRADIAERHLTPEARAAVKELLEQGEDLPSVAGWADRVKREFKESATWHYVDVPIDESRYDPTFCQNGACVVT
jgi:hypothetical protein